MKGLKSKSGTWGTDMLLDDVVCYSKLLWAQSKPQFWNCVRTVKTNQPCFEHEGLAGYIETHVTFHISDLRGFAEIWCDLSDKASEERQQIYYTLTRRSCSGD